MEVEETKLPIILNGKFFKITTASTSNKKVSAECLKCKKTYSGTLYSTTNFHHLKHLKTVHPLIFAEYENYKKENYTPSAKKQKTAVANLELESEPKPSIRGFIVKPQALADDLIFKYIIEDGQPINTVESKPFKNLVAGLSSLKQEVTTMTRVTLNKRISDSFMKHKNRIIEEIQAAKFVCTTADIWSSYRRSFLGITVHWIDENLQRTSYAIACRRFRGTHNYINIAKLLSGIHEEYNIDINKITMTITDNVSNFIKAFKHFNFNPNSQSEPEPTDTDNNDIDINETDEVIFNNVNSILNKQNTDDIDSNSDDDNINNQRESYSSFQSSSFDEIEPELPKHQRCASHTLSLLVTTDVQKAARINKVFGKLYFSVMGKCSSLWNLVNRSSSKASETYVSIAGYAPETPVITRWNSKYDEIIALLKIRDKLGDICKALNISQFTEKDIKFLQEYSMCLTHIAISLDALQGENNMYLGYLIPYIYAIYHNLKIEDDDTVEYCKSLVSYLKGRLIKRFACIFNIESPEARDLIIATITCPKWKLYWVQPEKYDYIKQVFIAVVTATENKNVYCKDLTLKSETMPMDEKEKDFFSFIRYEENEGALEEKSSIQELEAIKYLCDKDKSLESLHKYPIIKQLFIKYNAALPSSAPVERLFSFAGLVLCPRRSNLGDRRFEECTLLKANSCFEKK